MHGGLKDCDGFTPELIILIAYVVPFGFGWLLYHNRDLLPRFQRHIWLYVALTVPAWFIWAGVGRLIRSYAPQETRASAGFGRSPVSDYFLNT